MCGWPVPVRVCVLRWRLTGAVPDSTWWKPSKGQVQKWTRSQKRFSFPSVCWVSRRIRGVTPVFLLIAAKWSRQCKRNPDQAAVCPSALLRASSALPTMADSLNVFSPPRADSVLTRRRWRARSLFCLGRLCVRLFWRYFISGEKNPL